MRVFFVLFLFFYFASAKVINLSLPQSSAEESVATDVVNAKTDEKELKIAILIDENTFFKFLPSLINSIDAYLLNKDINFEVKVFNLDKNFDILKQVTSKYKNIFLYATTPEIVKKLSAYPENNFYLPIINRVQINVPVPRNVFLGGLNFEKQIKKLSSLIHGKTSIVKEKSILSNLTTKIEKSLIPSAQVFNYPINYQYRVFRHSYLFLNTNVVHTAEILSNFTYYGIRPPLVLSTQINYNPALFSLTTPRDTRNFIVANSLVLPNIRLLDVNLNLGSDLKFNWLNYTSTALLNKLYIDRTGEYPYFLNDLNIYFFNNQVEYKTKLFRVFKKGFIEIE